MVPFGSNALCVVRDITKHKKDEDKIKEQLDYLIRFEKATIQREFRMKELKDEIQDLKSKIQEMENKQDKKIRS